MPASWERDLVQSANIIEFTQKRRFTEAGLPVEVRIAVEDRETFRCDIRAGEKLHEVTISAMLFKAFRVMALLFLRSEGFTALMSDVMARHEQWCPATLRHPDARKVWHRFVEVAGSNDRMAELEFYHSIGDFEPPLQTHAGYSPENFSFWLCHAALLHVFFHEEGHLWAGHFELRRRPDTLRSALGAIASAMRGAGLGEMPEAATEDVFELRANLIAAKSLGEAAANQRAAFLADAGEWPDDDQLADLRRAHGILGDVILAFANAANLVAASVQNIEAGDERRTLRDLSFFGAAAQTTDLLRRAGQCDDPEGTLRLWNGVGRHVAEMAGLEFTPIQHAFGRSEEANRLTVAHGVLHRFIDRTFPDRGFGRVNPAMGPPFGEPAPA